MMNLSVAQMQLVEIAKALSHDAEVIFMDEPTSAIGEKEAQQLFAAIVRLKAAGQGHRLCVAPPVGNLPDRRRLHGVSRRCLCRQRRSLPRSTGRA